jgi:hypothetical protein
MVEARRRGNTSGLLSHNPSKRSHDLCQAYRSAKKAPKNLLFVRFPKFEVAPEAWLTVARTTLEDLIAAAEDAVRPLGLRRLGRIEHTRIIAESGSALHDLLERLPDGAPR